MLDDKQKLVEDDQEIRPALKYPILNFFGGTVTRDRLRHENAARHGGVEHWRNNTSNHREQDNVSSHINASGSVDYDIQVPQTANAYGAAQGSTGMGLEGENLHSFITTGSHYKVIPMIAPETDKNIFPTQIAATAQQQAPQTDKGKKIKFAQLSLTRVRGALYSYRSKASNTYSDLPAIAVNQ